MLFQDIVMIAICIMGALICAAYVVAEIIFKVGKKESPSAGLVMGALLLVTLMVGGTKSLMSKTSTDENIDLVDFRIDPIEEVTDGITNVLGSTFIIKVTSDSVLPQPIWFREDVHQTWTNVNTIASFQTEYPVLDAEQSGPGTNVYTWVSSGTSNVFEHAQWYIGVNLPAVEIEVTDTDVIKITEFNMTSKKVHIKFKLSSEMEFPEGTLINIERKIGNTWQTIDSIPAEPSGVYTWDGFEVGRRTVWRLSITKTEESELLGATPASEEGEDE